mmetsp:Transcript_13519/g.33095  ORF Transcript_13519/g.33095 Transcript_13519/m.33095 type:complete len:127 (-) Transcript_13519:7-387(-)
MLTNSYSQLRLAATQFSESKTCVQSLDERDAGSPVLVPITTSLFVKGTLCEVDKVLVDVGTGYIVEKDRGEAGEYFQRKVDYVQENLKRVEANVVEKRKAVNMVTQIMHAKGQEQMKLEKGAQKEA